MIYVNARFLTQKITGVQRYCIELCRQLKNLDSGIKFISPKKIIHHDIAEELDVILHGNLNGHAWEQIDLPYFLSKQQNPLLLNLANTAPILYKNKISTVHDVAFLRYPKSFSWKFRLSYRALIPLVILTSKKLITVSEFSKREIIQSYRTPPRKIIVINNAASDIFTNKSSASTCPTYLLAVSSLSLQKNFHGLIDAFNRLETKDITLKLVGDFSRNFADPSLLQAIDSNNRIELLGRVSDEKLVSLYKNATAFIFPSFYEGFGIPPLEAQACGCPVLVSNTASLPEVCGDSALYCSPHNTADIAEKINILLSDSSYREKLIREGYKNTLRFNWKTSALRLIDLARANS
ncbi:glycosyltransferase family 4 protein [Pseudomonas knackmussii]|uniref:glycosyltransferase family 4 protein n=1 Tax=Pseudomonas knackmussii TaxID=65741 RepID=UPI003F49DE0E